MGVGEGGGVGGGDGTSVLVELVLRQTVQTDCALALHAQH